MADDRHGGICETRRTHRPFGCALAAGRQPASARQGAEKTVAAGSGELPVAALVDQRDDLAHPVMVPAFARGGLDAPLDFARRGAGCRAAGGLPVVARIAVGGRAGVAQPAVPRRRVARAGHRRHGCRPARCRRRPISTCGPARPRPACRSWSIPGRSACPCGLRSPAGSGRFHPSHVPRLQLAGDTERAPRLPAMTGPFTISGTAATSTAATAAAAKGVHPVLPRSLSAAGRPRRRTRPARPMACTIIFTSRRREDRPAVISTAVAAWFCTGRGQAGMNSSGMIRALTRALTAGPA